MKKSKLMLLLVPALLLVGCNTTSNNNNSSSNTSGSGNSSSSETTNDVPDEYKPSADIPDAEKGGVITAEQAASILATLNLEQTITEEQSEQEIKDAPAVRLTQRTQSDNSSLFYKDAYSYGAKYSYFYFKGDILPECKDTNEFNHDESWHYDYVRDVDGSPVYFDLDHQIFNGWLDLSFDGSDVQYKSWDQYFYEEKPAEDFEKEETSLKSLAAINIALSQAGSMLGTYLQMGAMADSIPGMEVEIRSNGPDDLWFSLNALETTGVVVKEQVKNGKMVYAYSYTDMEKLPSGSSATEETGITKLVSELWFEEIAVSDLEYPNEAYYKEQAGK